jgi:hypothetical protein
VHRGPPRGAHLPIPRLVEPACQRVAARARPSLHARWGAGAPAAHADRSARRPRGDRDHASVEHPGRRIGKRSRFVRGARCCRAARTPSPARRARARPDPRGRSRPSPGARARDGVSPTLPACANGDQSEQ